LVLGRPTLRREYVQRRATSSRCQRTSVAGETKSVDQAERGNERLNAANSTRSAGRGRGRATRRRKTCSWWRSTRISSSFDRSERRPSTTSSTDAGTSSTRASPAAEVHPPRRCRDPTNSGRATHTQARAPGADVTLSRPNRVFGTHTILRRHGVEPAPRRAELSWSE